MAQKQVLESLLVPHGSREVQKSPEPKWASDPGAKHWEGLTLQVHIRKVMGTCRKLQLATHSWGQGEPLGSFFFLHANLLEQALQSPGSC